jgi:hypothetical protein
VVVLVHEDWRNDVEIELKSQESLS